jgi:putative ABC transport system substrate-binding protein
MSRLDRRYVLRALGCLGSLIATAGAIAQPTTRSRRVGALIGWTDEGAEAQLSFAALKERLAALGWIEGGNLHLDVRWAAGDARRASILAKELVALNPDVILSVTTPATTALQRETRTIPIVFGAVSDPVGAGFVQNLAHPGGNITGFIDMESSVVSKGLQMLTEIAPLVKRIGVMFNPQTAPFAEYYLRDVDSAAAKLRVKVFRAAVSSAQEIDRVMASLGREAGSGLMPLPDGFMSVHHKRIIALAAQYKVPTVYYAAFAVSNGGLISYGVDFLDLLQRAATYVDQILRGARPAELPVQQPEKFELYINLKTATSLGLTVPPSLRLRADGVIE